VLAFSIPLWSLEVYLYGSLSTPEVKPPEGVSYTVDLGDHAFSAADWETLLRRQEKAVLFPSLKDLETYRAFLSDRKEQVIVSDFYKDEKSPYKTFFTLNENYHTFIFLNFVTDEVSIPWEALQEDLRNQNPDALLVVGNSKNMATLQEKLSSFSATQFINRDTVGENFTQLLPLPEKEVFLFFYSSRCPVCRKLKNEVTPPAFAPYRDRIKVVYLDYTITANYEELIRLEEFWKVEEKSSVEIFSAAGYVASEDEASINRELEALIQKTLALEEGTKKSNPH
jgi:thiol-disulfide isomerase/thioredoxin